MKLYLEKSKCHINEVLNGKVWEIDTDDVVLIKEGDDQVLLNPDGLEKLIPEGPYLSPVPEDFNF